MFKIFILSDFGIIISELFLRMSVLPPFTVIVDKSSQFDLIFANSLSFGMSAIYVPFSMCAIIATYSGSDIAAIANFSTHGSSVSTSLLHAILLSVVYSSCQARHAACNLVFHSRNVVENQIETHNFFHHGVNYFIFNVPQWLGK